MGGNYGKSVFDQLMEVMAKLDTMEQEHKQNRGEIKSLTNEVSSLRNENASLREEVSGLKEECAVLKEKNTGLEKENHILRNDNERMKRILGNDSSNSSLPPSKDQPGKAPNTFNGRKPTKKKQGAQPGHKGSGLSKADVEKKILEGVYEHQIENIGVPGRDYITRYRLDLKVKTTATEIRIHADDNGKFQVPDDLKADVSYGGNIKAIAAFLYSEGVVANDRICTFINSLSGDRLSLSTGSVYGFCRKFAEFCSCESAIIEQELLNSYEICTDATTVKTDGKQTYIRNFSTERNVLYSSSESKSLEALGGFKVLKGFAGALTHDHETALYHFGTRHGECNVHLERYLLKNTEETGNVWSHNLSSFLNGLNHARNGWRLKGYTSFTAEQLERYSQRYDEIIALGLEENKQTKGRIAKKEEKTLLNRLKKYKENHLLFLYDFHIHFSNNMSEKDL
ncbi:MAG: IS66 family transposase, partial [Enterobacterales bacterium]